MTNLFLEICARLGRGRPQPFSGRCSCGSMGTQTRQRDLFPLPLLSEERNFHARKISRTVLQRHARKRKTLEWANDGLHTLNCLAGFRRSGDPSSCPEISRTTASDVAEKYFNLGNPPPDLLSPKEALSSLLSSSATYGAERHDLRSYVKEKTSWPPADSTLA